MLGRGKLIENVVYDNIIDPVSLTATATLYNGAAATTGIAIDTQQCEEVNIILQKGVCTGIINAAIYEHDSDDAASSTAISGADFTQITSANDEGIESMSLEAKNYKRYLWLRTDKITDTNACMISAVAVKSKFVSGPTTESPVADV